MKSHATWSATPKWLHGVSLVTACWLFSTAFIWVPENAFPTRYLPFYNIQAAAFLNGQVNLTLPVGWTHDVVTTSEGSFLALPPLVSFLLIPFVAFFGQNFPETLFSSILGLGFCIALWSFISHFGSGRTQSERSLVFVSTALGTPAFFAIVNGTSWFTASVAGCTFLMAGLLLIDRPPTSSRALAGLTLIALAALSRMSLAPLIPILGLLTWWRHNTHRRLSWLCFYLTPTVFFAAVLSWWNWARFGNIWTLGYELHGYGAHFQHDIETYGMTSLRYIFPHIDHGFLGLPRLSTEFPFFEPDPNGNGFFALSPIYLLTFLRPSPEKPETKLALLGLGVVLATVMTHFSTGWSQFGYRYILDILPFLILLLLGSRHSLQGAASFYAAGVSLYFSILGSALYLKILSP